MPGCFGNPHLDQKIHLKFDFLIIPPIMRFKNTVENVDLIFRKNSDQSSLVNIVCIMHHKC